MSTEPYPEVDRGRIGNRAAAGRAQPEWPKKIRTLTASELDRLTIDNAGRFYWDGKLVNYEPPEHRHRNDDEADRSAMDIIDRAVVELGYQNPAGADREHRAADTGRSQFFATKARGRYARRTATARGAYRGPNTSTPVVTPAGVPAGAVSHCRCHVAIVCAIIVVLGIAAGASGVAAYGRVVAHDGPAGSA